MIDERIGNVYVTSVHLVKSSIFVSRQIEKPKTTLLEAKKHIWAWPTAHWTPGCCMFSSLVNSYYHAKFLRVKVLAQILANADGHCGNIRLRSICIVFHCFI